MSSKKGDQTKGEATNGSEELTAVVEDLLNSLSTKFAGVSSEIFTKLDEMSKRLDNLEAALRTNQENSSPSSTPHPQ